MLTFKSREKSVLQSKASRFLSALGFAATVLLPLSMAQAKDGTIMMARNMDINTLDPHSAPIDISSQVIRQILDSLVTLDKDANVRPGIAESWEVSPDFLTYKFKIREGLKCHDGTAMDATAVKWNFERMARPETAGVASLRSTYDGSTIEGNTITVKFKTADVALLTNFGAHRFGIMCPSSDKNGTYSPVGTGPWKFVSWVRNDKVRLERNDNYKNVNPMIENPGAPHEKFLEFKVIPESVARMAAFRSGEVTIVEPALEEMATLKKDSKYTVWLSTMSGQWAYGAFTRNVPPFNDARVRQAIVHALDRDSYANIAFEGLGKPIYCPSAPNLPVADQKACASWGQTYNPEKARKLLADAGFTKSKPLKMTLTVHKLIGWDLMHQIMLQNLKDVGIDATLETRDVASFMEDTKKQNQRTEGIPMAWTWGVSNLDPINNYAFSFAGPGYLNAGLGEKFDEMVNASKLLTGEARAKASQELMKYMLSEALVFPIVSPGWAFYSVSSSKVKGFGYFHSGMLNFNDVTM
ncbi:MAG: ABC transporter substrate-binding protein [Ferrovibrio sp.]|uniref:ABC transporter substrate-binding protein n=1 Tax=Ferrovibrio sp. TaxID=1917215 RepID=UPI002629ACCC|nr:ABC transporter substrate-binding protein [Ferrovibrio sp.]MCW0236323.1 ABC transporter substrate-binding protein [Ferrovibrio sp.]